MDFNNKAQINKVFVYISSVILIVFVGFLVTKFVYVFQGDVETKVESEIYSKLEKDFNAVFKSYGSEKVLKYRLSSQVKYICFVSDISCFDVIENSDLNVSGDGISSLKAIFDGGDNVALFSDMDIINSGNIGDFKVVGGVGDCECIKPNNNYIDIVFENRNHKVYLTDLT